jgi:hypothetical protein
MGQLPLGYQTFWVIGSEACSFYSGYGPQPRSDGLKISAGGTTSASAPFLYSVVDVATYRISVDESGSSSPTFAWTYPEVVRTWTADDDTNTAGSSWTSTDYGVIPNTSTSGTGTRYGVTTLSETLENSEARTLNGISSVWPVECVSMDTASTVLGGSVSFTWGVRTYFTTSGDMYPNVVQVGFQSASIRRAYAGGSITEEYQWDGASIAVICLSSTGDISPDPNLWTVQERLALLKASLNAADNVPLLFYSSSVVGAQIASSGASTAAPSKSLTGGVSGSTMAVSTAWIKPGIHAPMPYPRFTAIPAGGTASSACGWSGATLHLTQTGTAGNTATSGAVAGAESPETTLVVTDLSVAGGSTGLTYTMFVPAGEVVFRNTGSGETRSWFSCGTTATFAGGSDVSAISFEPAVFGPALIGPAIDMWE